MTFSSLIKVAIGAVVAGALLAACGGGLNSAPSLAPLSTQRGLGLKSWMEPNVSKSLVYVDDDGTNDTYVLDYPSGKLVGTLTGFDYPYGECVDQKGDVYISNFDNGKLVEYAHGGTAPINTYTDNGGYLIGCSISAKGDVAATAFESSSGYGNVCIWKSGKGSPICVDGSSSVNCYYLWTFAYDRKGDLVGAGEYSGVSECAILSGSTSMVKLTTSGITLNSPGSIQWDGKYYVLDDQEAGNGHEFGLQPAKFSGLQLKKVGPEIILLDNCYSDYVEADPFFFGKKNVTAASARRATRVISPNFWCYDQGRPTVDVWKYPAGGDPIRHFTSGLTEPYGAAVSIAE